MALPYHLYVLATAGTQIELTCPLRYGTALVLIALVSQKVLISYSLKLNCIVLRNLPV